MIRQSGGQLLVVAVDGDFGGARAVGRLAERIEVPADQIDAIALVREASCQLLGVVTERSGRAGDALVRGRQRSEALVEPGQLVSLSRKRFSELVSPVLQCGGPRGRRRPRTVGIPRKGNQLFALLR